MAECASERSIRPATRRDGVGDQTQRPKRGARERRQQIDLWTAAGLVEFEIICRGDVYSGAVQSSSATRYGTLGINFRARKASSEEQLTEALAARQCDMPRAGQTSS